MKFTATYIAPGAAHRAYRAIHAENMALATDEARRIGRTDPGLHGFVLWNVRAA